MKTITLVFDPANCCENAEDDDKDFDLYGYVVNELNNADIKTEINEYDGDRRPEVSNEVSNAYDVADKQRTWNGEELSKALDMLESCRAALPDAWLAVKGKVPRELIDNLNALLLKHGRGP